MALTESEELELLELENENAQQGEKQPGLLGKAWNALNLPAEKSREGLDLLANMVPAAEPTGNVVRDVALNIPRVMAESVAETAPGFINRESILTAGAAKALAPVVGPAANLAAKGAEKVKGAAKALASSAGKRALGFTKKLLKTPLMKKQADEAVELALKEKVLKALATPEEMAASAEEISKSSGKAMGEFLTEQSGGAKAGLKAGARPQLREQFLFNPMQATEELSSLRPTGLNMGENQKINALIDHAIDTIRSHGTVNKAGQFALRPIPWEEARQLKTTIQGMANWDTQMSNAANAIKKQIASKMRSTFMNQLESAAGARGSGPGFDQFKGNVKRYGIAENMQDALQNRISDAGNSAVGLRDMIAGAGALAKTGDPVTAAATAGAFKVARRYGNQITAVGASKLAQRIQTNPEVYGKWGKVLLDASKRGGQSLAATDFVLQQKDPEYRALKDKLDAEEGQ